MFIRFPLLFTPRFFYLFTSFGLLIHSSWLLFIHPSPPPPFLLLLPPVPEPHSWHENEPAPENEPDVASGTLPPINAFFKHASLLQVRKKSYGHGCAAWKPDWTAHLKIVHQPSEKPPVALCHGMLWFYLLGNHSLMGGTTPRYSTDGPELRRSHR